MGSIGAQTIEDTKHQETALSTLLRVAISRVANPLPRPPKSNTDTRATDTAGHRSTQSAAREDNRNLYSHIHSLLPPPTAPPSVQAPEAAFLPFDPVPILRRALGQAK